MDARMDEAFSAWGRFTNDTEKEESVPAILRYDPSVGLELEFAGSPPGFDCRAEEAVPPLTYFGVLVNGTYVTVVNCYFRSSKSGAGARGLPTTFFADRALFGAHVPNLDTLMVSQYSIELSSLSNWMCVSPASLLPAEDEDGNQGVDIEFRRPAAIRVELPEKSCDVGLSHRWTSLHDRSSVSVAWRAGISIWAQDTLWLKNVMEFAWRCQNLMSLLAGHELHVLAVSLQEPTKHGEDERRQSLQLVYKQIGKNDAQDVHPGMMVLPYRDIRDQFPEIVRRWFVRSEQAALATDLLFTSDLLTSPAVHVRFLAATQAAEAYQRASGDGFYMDPQEYEASILPGLRSAIPSYIDGDHRQSLKNRLKYGNEHSLRKQLSTLLDRVPQNVRSWIANDASKFVDRVVNTRNYYTHYDMKGKARAYEGEHALVAAERVRILVIANVLQDLGIGEKSLLDALKRSQDFQHWVSQELPM